MGELLDALKSAETGANASTKSALDRAADLFRAASQRVNEAIDAVREPGMPLDSISPQMPLQSLFCLE